MAKIQTNTGTTKRRIGNVQAVILAGLCIFFALPQSAVVLAEDDRPVIVVPRASGRDLFQNCVLCHKYDGRGGPSEGGYAADLRVTKLTRDEVIGVITHGRPAKGMPPFGGMLDEYKINTLATFIKEELKKP
jgi:mono/diheme cytochrome c family protein